MAICVRIRRRAWKRSRCWRVNFCGRKTMANDELIALLKNLQGSSAGGALNPGLLAQLPSLIAAAAEPSPAASPSRGSSIASAASTVASSALRGVSGGLTLLPVVSSLLKLFGVGRKDE